MEFSDSSLTGSWLQLMFLEISIGPATAKHIGQIGKNVPSANLWVIPNCANGGCAGG